MCRALVTAEHATVAATGGADWSEFYVREFHLGIPMLGLNLSGNTGGGGAGTAVAADLLAVSGVSGIQPEHVGIVVIPQGHHKHHTLLESFVHGTHASLLDEIAAILGVGHPVLAELVRDGVVLISVHSVLLVLDGVPVLGIYLLHFFHWAVVGTVRSDELRGDGHWLRGVNGEFGSWSIEIGGSKTMRLNVTAIFVTDAIEAIDANVIFRVTTVATVCTLTSRLLVHST
jgi:hypothetical protein